MKNKLFAFTASNRLILMLTGFIPVLLFSPSLFFYNRMTSWDFVGHIFVINFIKDNLFPNPDGWIPFQSLGYSFGSYYPPLVHYIVAILSFLYNNPAFWIKALFLLTVFIFPFSIYFLTKNIARVLFQELQEKSLVLITQATFLVILFGPALYGGSIKSFLQLGLMGNFFTFPLLLFYIGIIIQFCDSAAKFDAKKILISSLLLSTIMLSHLLTGFVALLFTFIFALYRLVRDVEHKENLAKSILKSPFLLLLIISSFSVLFFYVNYLINRSYVSTPTPVPSDIKIASLLTLAFLVFTTLNFKNKLINERFKGLYFTMALILLSFTLISLIEYVTNKFGISVDFGLIQPYRLLSIALYLSPIWILLNATVFYQSFLNKTSIVQKLTGIILQNKTMYVLHLILLGMMALGIFTFDLGQKDYGTFKASENVKEISGNVFTMLSTQDSYYLYRMPYYEPLKQNKNIFYSDVQFIESSYTGSYNTPLERALYSYSGPKPIFQELNPETYLISNQKAKQLLSLMGIKYIVFSEAKKPDLNICTSNSIKEYGTFVNRTGKDGRKLYYCKVNENILPKDFSIKFLSNDNWKNESARWLLRDSDEVYIEKTPSNLPKDSRVVISPHDLKWQPDYQNFTVENTTDGISIIPVTFSPKWKAYVQISGHNVEIDVLRVTPSLLAIDTKLEGVVTFKYQSSVIERVLKVISLMFFLINLIAVVFLTAVRDRQNSK